MYMYYVYIYLYIHVGYYNSYFWGEDNSTRLSIAGDSGVYCWSVTTHI